MIEQKSRLLERIKAIEKLEFIVNNYNINNIIVSKPISDKQKKFLRLIKSGKSSIRELMENMPCSRPMVYKYYEMFLNKDIKELSKKEDLPTPSQLKVKSNRTHE